MQLIGFDLENFGPYRGYHSFDFRDKDTIGIVAQYEDNPDKSNRAGKSYLLEAPGYALHGIHRAKSERKLISRGEEHFSVTTHVRLDSGEDLSVKRGFSLKDGGILEISGHYGAGINKSKEILKEKLPVDATDYLLINYCTPDDLHTFMKAGPTEKSSNIRRWAGVNRWDILEKETAALLDPEIDELNKLRSRLETLEESGGDVEELTEDIERLKKLIKKMSVLLSSTEKKHSAVLKTLQNLEEANKALEMIERIESQIETVEEALSDSEDNNLRKKQIKERAEDIKGEIERLSKKRKQYQEIKVKIQSDKDMIERLEETKDESGICPFILEKCKRISPDIMDEEIESIQNSTQKLQNQLLKLQTDIDTLEDLEEEFSSLRGEWKALKIISKEEQKEKSSKLSLLRKTLEEKEQKARNHNPDLYEEKLGEEADLDLKITDYKKDIVELKIELSGVEKEFSIIKNNESKIEETKNKIESIEKYVSDLRYVRFMFGKTGIPSYELEESYTEIQERVTSNLERLGLDLTFAISPTRTLKTLERTCQVCGYEFGKSQKEKVCPDCDKEREKAVKDELQFYFLEDGFETDFDLDSGGGKVLISIAVRAALAAFRAERKGTSARFLILDEPFIHLDGVSRDLLSSVLAGKFRETLGIEKLFVISHVPEIRDAIPDIIQVTHNTDGFCTAEWL